MEELIPYYMGPCQVRFYDGFEYVGGIAYLDYIICGCCGGILYIKDVIEMAKKDGYTEDDAIIELEWVDIEKEIRCGK